MDFEIKIEQTINVTKQDIDDIMSIALDSGITHWCRKVEAVGNYLGEYASEQISRGGTLKLYDAEDAEVYELTLDKLIKGIKIAADNNYYSEYEWINENEIDCCQVDADVADTIVQCALFGDIVYG